MSSGDRAPISNIANVLAAHESPAGSKASTRFIVDKLDASPAAKTYQVAQDVLEQTIGVYPLVNRSSHGLTAADEGKPLFNETIYDNMNVAHCVTGAMYDYVDANNYRYCQPYGSMWIPAALMPAGYNIASSPRELYWSLSAGTYVTTKPVGEPADNKPCLRVCGYNATLNAYYSTIRTWQPGTGGGGGGGALTDGDYGDVTVSSSGTAITIDAGAVTYSKIQNVSATDRILGRVSAGAGTIQEITCTPFARTLLDDADAATVRTTLGLGSLSILSTIGTSNITDSSVTLAKLTSATAASVILGRGAGSGAGVFQELTLGSGLSLTGTVLSATGGGGGSLSDGDYGDITVGGTGTTMTIDNGAVTYAKIQNVSVTNRLLGRSTAGAGVVEEIPCTPFARQILDDADATEVRTTLGLGSAALSASSAFQPADADLTAIAALSTTSYGRSVLTMADAAANRLLLGLGALAQLGSVGTAQIDASAVTFAKMQNSTAASVLVGRGAGAGGGVLQELTLGAGLTMTGTVLSANALADGDKGDITVSAVGSTWTIDNGAVTYAKMQNVSATDRLLGRSSAGAGVVEEITCTSFARTLLDDASASTARTTLGLGALATLATVGTSQIDNSAVTFAKIANTTSGSVLVGRGAGASGAVQEITLGSGLSMTGTVLSATGGGGGTINGDAAPYDFIIPVSDETSNLSVGTNKMTLHATRAFRLFGVRATVTEAPTGQPLIVDINVGGASILSTKLSIDANEETSVTAAVPAVLTTSTIADNAKITIDIDQVGSSLPGKGLKVILYGATISSGSIFVHTAHGRLNGEIGRPLSGKDLFDDTNILHWPTGILMGVTDANTLIVALPGDVIDLPVSYLQGGASFNVALGRRVWYDTSAGVYKQTRETNAIPGLGPQLYVLAISSTTVTAVVSSLTPTAWRKFASFTLTSTHITNKQVGVVPSGVALDLRVWINGHMVSTSDATFSPLTGVLDWDGLALDGQVLEGMWVQGDFEPL